MKIRTKTSPTGSIVVTIAIGYQELDDAVLGYLKPSRAQTLPTLLQSGSPTKSLIGLLWLVQAIETMHKANKHTGEPNGQDELAIVCDQNGTNTSSAGETAPAGIR